MAISHYFFKNIIVNFPIKVKIPKMMKIQANFFELCNPEIVVDFKKNPKVRIAKLKTSPNIIIYFSFY